MAASSTKKTENPNHLNKPLAIVVIGMGIALIGGMVLLVARLSTDGAGGNGCEPSFYALGDSENAQVVSTDGRQVTLAVTSPSIRGKVLRSVDMCSGHVLRELAINPPILESL